MRTVTIAVHQFDELNEDAQEKAIEWMRNNIHDLYAWHDEAAQSIEAFCSKFGVTLQNYHVSPWERIDYKTNAANSKSMMIAADSQADTAVAMIGNLSKRNRIKVQFNHIIQCPYYSCHLFFHLFFILQGQMS
jgi:uncharacterized protein (UPF0210 family)